MQRRFAVLHYLATYQTIENATILLPLPLDG